MNIGHKRDRLIVIQHTKVSDDTGFGAKYEWKKGGGLWWEMLKQRITPVTAAGDAQAIVVTQGVKIRPSNLLAKGDRISLKSHTYDVIDVDTSQDEYYTLTCREVKK